MFSNEETIWTNQILFQHRDVDFNTNSSIDASISISTQDLKTFSNPFINLSITGLNDKKRRSCSLNLQLVSSILTAFNKLDEQVEKYFDKGDYEIVKKVSNKELQIAFKRSKIDSKQKCVLISIVLNQSDFGRIILDFDVAKLLFKSFEALYDKSIAVEISSRCLLGALFDKLEEVDRSIKSLPSLIGVINNIPKQVEQEAITAPGYE